MPIVPSGNLPEKVKKPSVPNFTLFFKNQGTPPYYLYFAHTHIQVKEKVKALLKTQRYHQAHINAMEDLKDSYTCTLEATDFKAKLEAKAKVRVKSAPTLVFFIYSKKILFNVARQLECLKLFFLSDSGHSSREPR